VALRELRQESLYGVSRRTKRAFRKNLTEIIAFVDVTRSLIVLCEGIQHVDSSFPDDYGDTSAHHVQFTCCLQDDSCWRVKISAVFTVQPCGEDVRVTYELQRLPIGPSRCIVNAGLRRGGCHICGITANRSVQFSRLRGRRTRQRSCVG